MKQKSAIVTGATKGIGYEIASTLHQMDYHIYALGRDFADFHVPNTTQVPIELSNQKEITKLAHIIKDENIEVLVNCAGFGLFAPHEELSFEQITSLVQVNLLAPLLLSKLFLRTLKKNSGYIFNINSISGVKSAPFGAVYGATKAGLQHFGTSLFEEARKSGLKVINIAPDITKSNFFDRLHFCYDEDTLTHISPQHIAHIIQFCIENGDSGIMTDIVIQPQKFRIKKLPKN